MKKVLFVIALISVLLIAGCSETSDRGNKLTEGEDGPSLIEDASGDLSFVDESEVNIGELI